MNVACAANIVIPEESSKEQEEQIKSARMTLKEVHPNLTTQKENYHPRNILKMAKDTAPIKGPTEPKRMKTMASKSTQTTTIEESDVTAESPSVHYWMDIAEQRRQALEETLDENLNLRIKIATQRANLDQARDAIKDLNSVIEMMTELVEEGSGNGMLYQVDDSGIARSNDSDGDD